MTNENAPLEAPNSPRNVGLWAGLGGLVIGLFLGTVVTLGVIDLTDDDGRSRTADEAASSVSADSEDAVEVDEDEPSYVPTPDDFSVELTVKDRECFGSAGCNVTYRVKPNYSALETPEETWEITYEVRGIEDGPQIETFTLDGDEFSFSPEIQVQTSGPNAEARTKITNVVEGY